MLLYNSIYKKGDVINERTEDNSANGVQMEGAAFLSQNIALHDKMQG
jgi:hypothetical protein